MPLGVARGLGLPPELLLLLLGSRGRSANPQLEERPPAHSVSIGLPRETKERAQFPTLTFVSTVDLSWEELVVPILGVGWLLVRATTSMCRPAMQLAAVHGVLRRVERRFPRRRRPQQLSRLGPLLLVRPEFVQVGQEETASLLDSQFSTSRRLRNSFGVGSQMVRGPGRLTTRGPEFHQLLHVLAVSTVCGLPSKSVESSQIRYLVKR
jgi:hypothetical protein